MVMRYDGKGGYEVMLVRMVMRFMSKNGYEVYG